MAVGLVPDRMEIADGIGALLIIMVLMFNLALAVPAELLRRRTTGSGH
jgi:phosphate transport system permease protein